MTFDFYEGPAGSGKTFNMVARVRNLVEFGALAEDQRVLALTFMNGARRRLTETLKADPLFRRRFDCFTFDSFAQTMSNRRSTKLTDEMRQNAEKLGQFHGPCYLASELLKDDEVRKWVARTYPLVLVDEAQDLDESRQGIIRGLADSCAVVVAADAFQCLADGQETADFIGWLKHAGTAHVLRQSHRTNKRGLLAAALAVRNGNSIKDSLEEKPIGKSGRVHWVGEGIELSEVPARANNPGLLAWSIAFQLTRGTEDVAILTPDAKNIIIRNCSPSASMGSNRLIA